MKIAFHTLGCKVNQYETEVLREIFMNKGYELSSDEEFADVYVINTCTVTGMADRKSRQMIRKMKRMNPESIICVTGCYAQVNAKEIASIEGVDIVAGTGEKMQIPAYVEEYLRERASITQAESVMELVEYDENPIISEMAERTRAFIKVQEGCNRFCSYCIIPYARGAVRSRAPESIVAEAEELLRRGVKEIILTGINTALYGMEKSFSSEKPGLFGIEILIDLLSRLPGDFRIRLSSLEPTVVDAAYIQRLFIYEKLCRHIHLSAQSGSSTVLSRMNRRYTAEEYLKIVDTLQKFDPLYGISTDIIAGFPGESEMEFAETLQMVRQVDFCKVHVFKYSGRKGTLAETMQDQLPAELKSRRSAELASAGNASAKRFFERNTGKTSRVLLEEYLEKKSCYTGYTENYIKVYLEKKAADDLKVNAFYDVKLLSVYEDGMKGEISAVG